MYPLLITLLTGISIPVSSQHLFLQKNVFTQSGRTESNKIEEHARELTLTGSHEYLVQQARAGDTQAFDRLVALHQERVYALAHRILGDPDDAADVQQETFIRAWRNLGKFKQKSEFSTWLHRIALNLCLSRKRRKNSVTYVELNENELPHVDGPGDSIILERKETAAAVHRALASLPAHHRAMIVLRDMEDRSFEEIAAILGCSQVSVRVRVSRARKLLRERVRPYLEDDQ